MQSHCHRHSTPIPWLITTKKCVSGSLLHKYGAIHFAKSYINSRLVQTEVAMLHYRLKIDLLSVYCVCSVYTFYIVQSPFFLL